MSKIETLQRSAQQQTEQQRNEIETIAALQTIAENRKEQEKLLEAAIRVMTELPMLLARVISEQVGPLLGLPQKAVQATAEEVKQFRVMQRQTMAEIVEEIRRSMDQRSVQQSMAAEIAGLKEWLNTVLRQHKQDQKNMRKQLIVGAVIVWLLGVVTVGMFLYLGSMPEKQAAANWRQFQNQYSQLSPAQQMEIKKIMRWSTR